MSTVRECADSCLHCLSDALLPSAMSLTSTTLGSKSKRSWSTAVAPLANHVRFTLTLTSHGITNQRPVLVSLGSRGITVTRYKQKQKIELTHSISLCWGGGGHPNPLLRVVLVLYRFLSHSRKQSPTNKLNYPRYCEKLEGLLTFFFI